MADIPNNTSGARPREIVATVAFNGAEAMVGIPVQPAPLGVRFDGSRLVTAAGATISMPGADSRERVLRMLRSNPAQVFVVEFGPLGPVAEHEIAVDPTARSGSGSAA